MAKYVHPVQVAEDTLVFDHFDEDDDRGVSNADDEKVVTFPIIEEQIAEAGDEKGDDRSLSQWSCANLIRLIREPNGPSGHSYFRKVRFAGSLFSPFHIFTVLGASKDIYLEKFGADPAAMSVIVVVMSTWGIFATFIHGVLQDARCLSLCFPLERWGRRAPWMLTHCLIASFACIFVYLPDLISKSAVFTHAWYGVLVVVGLWGGGSCVTAFESARQEIYPYKEERIIVEGFCKYSAMAGGASGGVPFLVLAAFSTFTFRILMSFCWILPCSLMSLESVPVLREARSAGNEVSLYAIVELMCEALPFRKNRNSALQHLMLMSFWNGAYGTWIATSVYYYVTYVLRPQSAIDRTFILGGAGLTAGITESILNLVYMRMFGVGDARHDKSGSADSRLLKFVVGGRVVNAILTILLIGVAPPSVPLFFLWSFCARVGLCGFTFWRISAKCWLVDEDIFLGRRREATLFGAISLAQSVAGALFSSWGQINIAAFGFKTRNCEDDCEGFAGEQSDCMDACYREMVAMQPDGFRTYCKLVIGVIAPLCELLVAFHAFIFPIKGVRLRRVYHNIMANHGDDSYLDSPTSAQGNVMSRTIQAPAASKQVLVIDSLEQVGEAEWQEHLDVVVKNMSTKDGKTSKVGKSCAVIFETLEDYTDMKSSPSSRQSVRSCYSRQDADSPIANGNEILERRASEVECEIGSDTIKYDPDASNKEPGISKDVDDNAAELLLTIPDYIREDIVDSPVDVENALQREASQRRGDTEFMEVAPSSPNSQCCWPLPCKAFSESRSSRGERIVAELRRDPS